MGKLGIDCKLYYNTGTYGSPTWTEIALVRDATLALNWDTVEAPARDSRVKKKLKSVVEMMAEFSVRVSDTDAGFIALWNALVGRTTTIDILLLNGGTAQNGARGARFDALITQGSEDQGISAALYQEMRAEPSAASANQPSYVVVASGAPVYTAA